MQEHMPGSEQAIGVVTHYWNHLGVAGVHLTEPVDVGDHIHIHGQTTDFEQDLGSMHIEHQPVMHANAGEDVGIRVSDHAREHDVVYKATEQDVGADQNLI